MDTLQEIEHTIVSGISQISGIPLLRLSEFKEEHLHALVVTTPTNFGYRFLVSTLGIDITTIRKVAKSGSNNNYSDFYRKLGLPEHWLRLWNTKSRYEYLIESGYGRKLILEYAQSLLEKESGIITKEEKAAKLFQDDYKKSKTIVSFMPSKIAYTAALALDFDLVESPKDLHVWPQGFLVNYPDDAQLAYESIKSELSINGNDWNSITSKKVSESTKYGTKMLSQFDNSIYGMVMFFEGVEPKNIVKKQGYFHCRNVLKKVIEGALNEFHDEKGNFSPKKLSELPKISLKEMSRNSQLSSYISAISRTHCISHPELMCELFPEMNWIPSDFPVSGVPDNYWFSENGELNTENTISAIDRMLEKMYSPEQLNDEKEKLRLVGFLTQGDFREYNLGVLGSPNASSGGRGWTIAKILKACYPAVDLSHRTHTKSACRFYSQLVAEQIAPDISDPLSLMEKRINKTESTYLFDDLHIDLEINGSMQTVVFELQGSQHYSKSSKFYTSSIIVNDAFKFVYHELNGTRIYYVKSEKLSKNVWKQELLDQHFDIEKGIAHNMDTLKRAKLIEDLGFVHSGFTEQVTKLLKIKNA